MPDTVSTQLWVKDRRYSAPWISVQILVYKVSLFVELSVGVVSGSALPSIVPLCFSFFFLFFTRVPPLQLTSSTPPPTPLDFWVIRKEAYSRQKRSLLLSRAVTVCFFYFFPYRGEKALRSFVIQP